jgi:hypothetical protein
LILIFVNPTWSKHEEDILRKSGWDNRIWKLWSMWIRCWQMVFEVSSLNDEVLSFTRILGVIIVKKVLVRLKGLALVESAAPVVWPSLLHVTLEFPAWSLASFLCPLFRFTWLVETDGDGMEMWC